MVFDDGWTRSVVPPENQSIELNHDAMARWDQHLVMVYAHDAKGFWFDR